METTTNSIAACAASTTARGRFGIKNIACGSYPKFKANRHVAGMEPAQSAIEFEVVEGRSQTNAGRAETLKAADAAGKPLFADPVKGLRSLATWDASVNGRNTLGLNNRVDWRITAVDYNDSRYKYDSSLRSICEGKLPKMLKKQRLGRGISMNDQIWGIQA